MKLLPTTLMYDVVDSIKTKMQEASAKGSIVVWKDTLSQYAFKPVLKIHPSQQEISMSRFLSWTEMEDVLRLDLCLATAFVSIPEMDKTISLAPGMTWDAVSDMLRDAFGAAGSEFTDLLMDFFSDENPEYHPFTDLNAARLYSELYEGLTVKSDIPPKCLKGVNWKKIQDMPIDFNCRLIHSYLRHCFEYAQFVSGNIWIDEENPSNMGIAVDPERKAIMIVDIQNSLMPLLVCEVAEEDRLNVYNPMNKQSEAKQFNCYHTLPCIEPQLRRVFGELGTKAFQLVKKFSGTTNPRLREMTEVLGVK